MNIAVIGTGYVGLVVGTCLADRGWPVTCVDSASDKLRALQDGISPVYEPGLQEMLRKNLQAGRLRFSEDLPAAVDRSQVVFVTVQTGAGPDGSADLTSLFDVAHNLARSLREYKVIAIKSTVPPGTARRLAAQIRQQQTTPISFDIISNPEFLREGSAIETFLKPNYVLLGHSSPRGVAILQDLYRNLYSKETPIVVTDHDTAELTKYAANAFLATKISFINEMANACDALHCDIQVIAEAMGMDPRIGRNFLHPGPGWGGNCFPKDTRALLRFSADSGCEMRVVQAAIEANNVQPQHIVERLRLLLGELPGQCIAVLGLAFKGNTDDVRQSPAIAVCKELLASGCRIRAHDPAANKNAAREIGRDRVTYHNDPYQAAAGAAALLILTEWSEFRNLDLERIKSGLAGNCFLDGRNLYEPARLRSLGFRYVGIGRGGLTETPASRTELTSTGRPGSPVRNGRNLD